MPELPTSDNIAVMLDDPTVIEVLPSEASERGIFDALAAGSAAQERWEREQVLSLERFHTRLKNG